MNEERKEERRHSRWKRRFNGRSRSEFRKHWQHKGRNGRSRVIFIRFFAFFGLMALLVLGGMAAISFVLARLYNAPEHTAVFVWIGGCSLSIIFPMFAARLAFGVFQRVARPLADVMEAADAVAEGDLSVRVSEKRPGEFRQLAQSFNRMASQLQLADQQRRNLTADVAHELRTPLHIIQGNLEGILDGVYQPTPEHIADTLEETALLGRLVEDLRTLSLAESGHLRLQKEGFDLGDLLDDLQTSFSGQAEGKGITLRFEREKRPLYIMGDADRLTQALSNLIVNALRHTPADGIVTITAVYQDGQVRLTVADTGEGISGEALPFVFDRFWKAEKSRTGSGSGLGLAITKQLVVAHGGTIDVDSQLGEGSTFTITLPYKDEAQATSV